WTPRSDAYFASPLAQGTPGKQCGLAATGDYQPSLRSPWLAAAVKLIDDSNGSHFDPALVPLFHEVMPEILDIKERYVEETTQKKSMGSDSIGFKRIG
ncbi:MAG: hypothetical protein JMN26_13780, partial [gamma proteobacterium endosymbiont of Lamellibrachia anaximandri]|nr:hypothetical protein [gamma proteobacterium endosymbiont of Lamellibrachia anaximandri]